MRCAPLSKKASKKKSSLFLSVYAVDDVESSEWHKIINKNRFKEDFKEIKVNNILFKKKIFVLFC